MIKPTLQMHRCWVIYSEFYAILSLTITEVAVGLYYKNIRSVVTQIIQTRLAVLTPSVSHVFIQSVDIVFLLNSK